MCVNLILKQGREILHWRGWRRGAGYNGSGPICISQAIGQVDAPESDKTHAYAALLDAMYRASGHRFLSVCTWNDSHLRTEAEVYAVFDDAIHATRVQEVTP